MSCVSYAGSCKGVAVCARRAARPPLRPAMQQQPTCPQHHRRAARAAQVATADLRDASTLADVVAGVDAVACCTGTTAFPSNR